MTEPQRPVIATSANIETEDVLIDGEPIPWGITADVTVHPDEGGINLLTITVVIDGPVVVHGRPERGRQ